MQNLGHDMLLGPGEELGLERAVLWRKKESCVGGVSGDQVGGTRKTTGNEGSRHRWKGLYCALWTAVVLWAPTDPMLDTRQDFTSSPPEIRLGLVSYSD